MGTVDTPKRKIENEIEIKNILENIKSKYILKQIFINLPKRNQLKILKYNKKLQEKLELNLNDYEDYTSIEIEIIPVKDKFGYFMKFLNEYEKPFYHIYFNDNIEEIKRYKLTKNKNNNRLSN